MTDIAMILNVVSREEAKLIDTLRNALLDAETRLDEVIKDDRDATMFKDTRKVVRAAVRAADKRLNQIRKG